MLHSKSIRKNSHFFSMDQARATNDLYNYNEQYVIKVVVDGKEIRYFANPTPQHSDPNEVSGSTGPSGIIRENRVIPDFPHYCANKSSCFELVPWNVMYCSKCKVK